MESLFFERVFIPLLVTAITALCGWIVKLLKDAAKSRKIKDEKDDRRFDAIERASRASLHDRLKWECKRIIKQGYRTTADSKNLRYMFDGYTGINGNSIIDDLFTEAMKNPIREED